MARIQSLAALVGLLAVGLVGCAPSGSPGATSGSPTAPEVATGCQPIDVLSPEGQRVNLNGAWTTAGHPGFFYGGEETTWILQVDDCVWASITDAEFLADPASLGGLGTSGGGLGTLQAHITRQFSIEGVLVTVARAPGAPGPVADIRLLIEWDANGQIRLREDRDRNVQGPRCSFRGGGIVSCPSPVILYRSEDVPAPMP